MGAARSTSKKQQVMATEKKTGREANKETKNSVFCLWDGCGKIIQGRSSLKWHFSVEQSTKSSCREAHHGLICQPLLS